MLNANIEEYLSVQKPLLALELYKTKLKTIKGFRGSYGCCTATYFSMRNTYIFLEICFSEIIFRIYF